MSAETGAAASPIARLGRVFLLFLPMAALGTLAHEAGHVGVARALGRETRLHHGCMESWEPPGAALAPEQLRRREDLVTLGGPASTALAGTLGLLWLVHLRRREGRDSPPGPLAWCATLLALFWSRQVANPLMGLAAWALRGAWPTSGDEAVLARAWGRSEWLTSGLPGLLGLAVCVAVVLLHPPRERARLVAGGVSGSVAGFGLWYGLLGPWLLP